MRLDDEVAWAARALGILEDEESVPDLVALAALRRLGFRAGAGRAAFTF